MNTDKKNHFSRFVTYWKQKYGVLAGSERLYRWSSIENEKWKM